MFWGGRDGALRRDADGGEERALKVLLSLEGRETGAVATFDKTTGVLLTVPVVEPSLRPGYIEVRDRRRQVGRSARTA